ncbi:MAG TPA: GNAT family N-acetyltransferase [Alphaproteobacteria bacterium]|nr:GNAT family N-acetyltransferase [Alphaproteobacteria bacterium]
MRESATEQVPVSPPGTVIRRARPEEAATVADLIRRAFAQYRGRLTPPAAALDVTAAGVGALMAAGLVLVAETDGALAGCVALQDKGSFAYAGRLAVDPALRDFGLGRALVQAAARAARDLGHTRLRVDCRLALDANRRFFAAQGFVEGAQRCHPGFTRPTYVELEKSLI